MTTDALLQHAIDRAAEYVLRQADRGFPEARHEMYFPSTAGFTGAERQSSDVFARAVLGGLAVDIAAQDGRAWWTTAFRRLAEREANYVASRKLTTRRGGWSYFPDLPELPPDLDSLAAALALFAAAAPRHLPLCDEPIGVALRDGSFATWIVAPDDDASDRARMAWGIQACWGGGTDADVVANLCNALARADRRRYAEHIARGTSLLIEGQQRDGSWLATWYAGAVYATVLVGRLLAELGTHAASFHGAIDFLRRGQRDDGAWGEGGPLPLDTAMAMWGLEAVDDPAVSRCIGSASAWLVDVQNPDGSWFSSPWIQMPIGRATGATRRVATHESVTISTGFCLRSLVAFRRRTLAEWDIADRHHGAGL